MDDVYASQVQVLDNEDNRKQHQMIQRDDLIISMDLLQAIKREIKFVILWMDQTVIREILLDNAIQVMIENYFEQMNV